jgi:thiol:disulfide interchange protein DsbG
MTLNRRHLTLGLLGATTLGLAACSRTEDAASANPAPIPATQALEAAAAARGFDVGAIMSTHKVYVLFDPQCPHCAHLWKAAVPLLGKAHFVWAPVSLLGPKSLPQGAALLQAANPQEAMTAHEASLLANAGGIAASSSVPAELEAAIQANTQLLNRLGAESVPFIVSRNLASGQTVTHAGSMNTAALATLLGIAAN